MTIKRDFYLDELKAGNERMWMDEGGIVHVGVIPFLLDESILMGE